MDSPASVSAQGRALFSFRIGGVQEFVDRSRTTQDFYTSSALIELLASRVAEEIAERGELIFPATQGRTDSNSSGQSAPNGIMALVLWDRVEEIGQAAEDRLNSEWADLISVTEDNLTRHDLLRGVAKEIWIRQTGRKNFEAFWAAVPWPEGMSYSIAYRELSRASEARRLLRDFEGGFEPGWKCSRCGRFQALQDSPEHSRDALRDYWKRAAEASSQLTHRFRASEPLCSVCICSRLVRGRLDPSSTSSVAAAPFREYLNAKMSAEVKTDFEKKVRPMLTALKVSNSRQAVDSMDGDWFFETTYDAGKIERDYFKVDPTLVQNAKSAFQEFRKHWEKEPCRYIALLMADGDRIGDLIRKKDGIEGHRSLSEQVSKIGPSFKNAVEEARGEMIYSGGDDVLAFVPAGNILAALDKGIRDVQSAEVMGASFGMSAGVLIIPHTDSLSGSIREAAALMRKEAKDRYGRGCTVIAVRRQSGQQTHAALPWGSHPALRAFGLLTKAMASKHESPKSISARLVGQIAEIAPGLSEVSVLDAVTMVKHLTRRHSSARGEVNAKQLDRQLEAVEQLMLAAEDMARKSTRTLMDVFVDMLLTARTMSQMIRGSEE